jgi:DNA-binding NarL/FixJ family response regulator
MIITSLGLVETQESLDGVSASGHQASSLRPPTPTETIAANAQSKTVQSIPIQPVPVEKRVVLIDGRQLTRESLCSWLQTHLPSCRTIALDSVSQIVGLRDGAGAIAAVFLSVGASHLASEDLELIRAEVPDVPILVISDIDDVDCIVRALGFGIRGFIPTSTALSVLVGAIQLVEAGGTFIPASALTAAVQGKVTTESLPEADATTYLTPRQAEVLALLRQGKPNKVIAYELSMCEGTVKVHVRNIMRRFKATNRTQLAFMFNERDESRAEATGKPTARTPAQKKREAPSKAGTP